MFRDYRALITKLDATARRLAEQQQPHVNCRAGCDACCQYHLSFTAVERAYIVDAIGRMPTQKAAAVRAHLAAYRERDAEHPCPLLGEDGRCLAYEARPLICRTHGLLFNFAGAEETPEIKASCDLNHKEFDLAGAAASDAMNQVLISTLLFQVNGLFMKSDPSYDKGRDLLLTILEKLED